MVLGYRADEWRRNRKMLETPEFRPFFDTSQAELLQNAKSTAAHSGGKCAGPAIEK